MQKPLLTQNWAKNSAEALTVLHPIEKPDTRMLKRRTPLAWLQLLRQRGRFLVAIVGIAFANILIWMQLGFQSALYDSNTRLHRLLLADIVLVSPQAQNFSSLNTIPRRRLFQAANLPEVRSVEPLYASLAFWKNPQTKLETAILVVGFNPTKSVFALPEVNQNLSLLTFPNTLLFDRKSRGQYQGTIAQVEQGKPVITEIQGRKVVIRSLYTVGASFVSDGSVMTSDQNFLRIFTRRQASEVSLGLIELVPGSDAYKVATQLGQLLPNDVVPMTRQQFIALEENYWRTNTSIGFIFSLGVVMGFVVGVIVVYQILYSDVVDHLAEYATLKAIGYRDIYLLGLVFQEALILALSGYIPGYFISSGLYKLTRDATNLPLFIQLDRALLILILTIVMCSISGAIAMRKLRSADPAEIF